MVCYAQYDTANMQEKRQFPCWSLLAQKPSATKCRTILPQIAWRALASLLAFVFVGELNAQEIEGVLDVQSGGSITGDVSSEDRNDWYSFTLANSGTLKLRLSELEADADLCLYRGSVNRNVESKTKCYGSSSQQILASSVGRSASIDEIEWALGPNTYYIRVDSFDDEFTSYRLMYGLEVPPKILVSLRPFEVNEGSHLTYQVELMRAPDHGAVVTVRTSDPSALVAEPSQLRFTPNDLSPQDVRIMAKEDDDAVSEEVTIFHETTDLLLDGSTTTIRVTGRVIDNDTDVDDVRLSVDALEIDEGRSGTYTVVLTRNPGGDVTITPISDNAAVTVSPASLTFDANNWDDEKIVTVSAAQDEDAIDVTATISHAVSGYGNATADSVSVRVSDDGPDVQMERAAVTETLATVTAATVSNVTTNIGARFSAARSGTSLSLAGQSAAQYATYERMRWDSLWNEEGHSRALNSEEVMRSTDFQIALGAGESTLAQAAEQWTFWGRGDLQYFSSEPDRGPSYTGDLKAAYLGFDMQVDDRWLAGVAVSRTVAEADYSLGISGAENDGKMDVTLTSLIPYVRFAPDSESELWAIIGAGQGAIENNRPGAASSQESTDVAMWMASAGGRRAVANADPLDLAFLGDVGFGRIMTEDGVQRIAGLTVDTWRARIGIEGSYTIDAGNSRTLTSFMEVAGRYDGGDGGEVGLELSPGIYFSHADSGFGLEVRGRALVLHSAENYAEYGGSVTASMTPRSDGQGLSLSLSPRWGGDSGGAETLWRDDSFGQLGARSNDRNAMSLDARVGYGFDVTDRLLLTPFGEVGLRDEDRRQVRIGTRLHRGHFDKGALNLELTGAQRENAGDDPEHLVAVTGHVRF